MAHTQIRRIQSHLSRWPIPDSLRPIIHRVSLLAIDVLRSDVLKQASAMAYVTLLSLIPSLVAIFSIISLFSPLFLGERNLIAEMKSWVLTHLAAGSGENVVQYLDEMLQRLDLKTIGWSSFASVLVTLVMLLRQIEIALNNIWQIKKPRNVFVRFMYFWTFLTLVMLGIGALVGLSIPAELKKVVNPSAIVESKTLFDTLLKFCFSFGASFLFFFLLYKVIPNCKVRSKPAIIGALFSAVVINEVSYLYGLFVRDSDNYKTIYGAMAQLPIFLMWLYVSWSIILLGALLAWRMQEGFPSIDIHDSLDDHCDFRSKYRNLRIKSDLPLIALVAVCKRFIEGHNRGLSSQEFALSVEIPDTWAADTFAYLIELEFIHPSQPHTTPSTKNPIAPSFSDSYNADTPCYPSFLPSQMSLPYITERISASYDEWLQRFKGKKWENMREILFPLHTPRNEESTNLHDLAMVTPLNL